MRVGLDIGSTTIKCVVLNDAEQIVYSTYERHYSHILEKGKELLHRAAQNYLPDGRAKLAISGSAGMGLADSCKVPFVQEVFATRVAANKLAPGTDCIIELGGEDAKILFLTNAAGGVNTSFHAGDLMLIRDHISVFAPNPLIGTNIDELGLRFPDMSHVYDKDLQQIIRETAKDNGIYLQEGIYTQLTGPSFESPAEIRMLRTLGCDAVGMSTVVEAIAANHMGMRICGISCISNLAAGMTDQPLNHEEVQEAADMAAPRFKKLVTESVKRFV